MTESNKKQAMVRLNSAEIQKIASHFPETCKPVFDDVSRSRNDLLKQLSSHIPNAINVAHTANSADAFKVVNDVVLKPGEDGLYSAVVRNDNGRIIEHVKLEKSTSDFAKAATFSYSILNAAVGQANMMDIAECLAEIENQLDEAKKRDYAQQINAVNSACITLRETLCLDEEDHRKQSILMCRNKLHESLANLYDYIKIEIEAMPEYHEKSLWEKIISNWGTSKSTLPAKAQKRFEYVAGTLPVWCRGMSQLVLTDAYVNNGEFPSTRFYINGLKQLIMGSCLANRVKYVPLIGHSDPIELVNAFQKNIPEAERFFVQMRDNVVRGNLAIELNAN